MLRDDVEQDLWNAHEDNGRVYPAYEDYCFGNVPDTIQSLLDVGSRRALPDDVFQGVDTDVERVVLVLVDGYGLNAWRRDRERVPFVDRLTERATVTPLTSIYPSETAAAITTLETGQYPCEHGRVGWNVFEPETDRTFQTFSGEIKSGDRSDEVASETLEGVDYHYEDLGAAGVNCHRLQPFDEETPGVTQHTYDGEDLTTVKSQLGDVVEDCEPPGYVYCYVPHVDHVSHEVGPNGPEFDGVVEEVFRQLAGFVDDLDENVAEETLVLVTADHGHVETDPERNVDLSARKTVMANLRRHENGEPVQTSGSIRNVHLHLQPDTVEETREALSDLDARIFTRNEVLDRDLFGDRESAAHFQRRCGDLVLTHRDLGVWFGDAEPEELELVGMHGGLHPHEMLIPFAAVRADRLQQ